MSTKTGEILRNGLWDNNVVLVQLLALCPLLAVTGTAANGLGMGLATMAVLMASGLSISLLSPVITHEIRIPAFVLIIAALVTLVEMMMNAWMHQLYKILGLFIPLIVTNCVILGRAEVFASRNRPLPALLDGFATGLGFTLVLVVLGAVREILGYGTLFAKASLLLGRHFAFLETTLIAGYKGVLIFVLPPGGFIVLGFLIAGKRLFDRRAEKAGCTVAGHTQAVP
jgi:electron transport complex protein RnfE